MSQPTAASGGPDPWGRPLFTPGGGDAFISFVVFGADAALLEISTEEHRVDEVPAGVDAHEMGPDWVRSLFDPPLGDQIRQPTGGGVTLRGELRASCLQFR